MPSFPSHRPRRLRRTAALRNLVRETHLAPSQLILPVFVREGKNLRRAVESMPGVNQTSVDEMLRDAEAAAKAKVGGIILFGVPDSKDAIGSSAWDENGAVQKGVQALKKEIPDLVAITDVRTALSHAAAGADIVAPSDMMDGRVRAIRCALDENDFAGVSILSYAAKYASAYYGPFREAAESAPKSGDRRGYQMDPGNADEALREVRADIDEGADAVMVKPAGPYLDVITRVKAETGYPVAAYQVSGEYAMICAAADRGWIDKDRVMMESLLGIRRAGADFIVSYFATDAARALASG
ncbi:MAG: porphobilinogen synthase [Gemmatimonadetes bacterium]|nr:MAG: porphobilinogen synthase [Gemmatimonadota bacterium]